MTKHALESAAQANADATSKPPFQYELGLDGARRPDSYLPVTPAADGRVG